VPGTATLLGFGADTNETPRPYHRGRATTSARASCINPITQRPAQDSPGRKSWGKPTQNPRPCTGATQIRKSRSHFFLSITNNSHLTPLASRIGCSSEARSLSHGPLLPTDYQSDSPQPKSGFVNLKIGSLMRAPTVESPTDARRQFPPAYEDDSHLIGFRKDKLAVPARKPVVSCTSLPQVTTRIPAKLGSQSQNRKDRCSHLCQAKADPRVLAVLNMKLYPTD
jgi:hypothetical protein